MAKLVLNALLRRDKEGVQAEVAEFPDIKVSALSISVAVARVRKALWQRMRWIKAPETSCHGEPISPVPREPAGDDLTVPIEVETTPKNSVI